MVQVKSHQMAFRLSSVLLLPSHRKHANCTLFFARGVWMRTWYNSDPQSTKDNTMNILRLVVEDPEYTDSSAASDEGVEKAKGTHVTAAIASLLAAAQADASEWHMGSVDIWNPTSATLAAAKQLDSAAQVVHREKDSVASLRWYGEGSVDDVQWLDNEKYAWC